LVPAGQPIQERHLELLRDEHHAFLAGLGRVSQLVAEHAGQMGMLLWGIVAALGRGKVSLRETINQMYWMGIGSLPIVLVTATLAGVVTSQQGGYQFTGSIPLYIMGSVVTSSIVLELGPVLTAVVLIGRDAPPFSDQERDIVSAFLTQALVAIDNARLFAELQNLATTDTLTQVHNRRYFFELAELEFARSKRYQRDVSLVLLDADIYGVAGHYNRNSRPLTPEHRRLLEQLIADMDRIRDDLPHDQARDYFHAYRRIATHLLSDPARGSG
jgi:GAF domain-containing protein